MRGSSARSEACVRDLSQHMKLRSSVSLRVPYSSVDGVSLKRPLV